MNHCGAYPGMTKLITDKASTASWSVVSMVCLQMVRPQTDCPQVVDLIQVTDRQTTDLQATAAAPPPRPS